MSESSSGSSTISSAPSTGPSTEPAPPTITASTNRIDWEKGNEAGLMNIISGATSEPARPVSSADRPKARVLVCTGLKPSERAAMSEALTARMAVPQPLLRRRW